MALVDYVMIVSAIQRGPKVKHGNTTYITYILYITYTCVRISDTVPPVRPR